TSEPDDACIAAVTVFIAHTELIEKPLDGCYARRADRSLLCFALFPAKTALCDLECRVACMKISGSLTAKIHFPHRRIRTVGLLSLSGERDRLLNERPQLFCLVNGRDDVFLIGVDKRGRKVTEHRHTMLGRASKFAMCFLMSHDDKSNIQTQCSRPTWNIALEHRKIP